MSTMTKTRFTRCAFGLLPATLATVLIVVVAGVPLDPQGRLSDFVSRVALILISFGTGAILSVGLCRSDNRHA